MPLDRSQVPDIPAAPWPPLSGAFADDDLYREMLAEVARYRRELDQEDGLGTEDWSRTTDR